MKRIAYIGLGSNQGEVVEALNSAIESLRSIEQTEVVAVSPFYRSAPIDAPGPDFMNAVVKAETALEPYALLLHLLDIELMLGRKRRGLKKNAPRNVDLDLLLLGDMHTERYEISEGTADAVNSARRAGRRVVAVGTTSLRALESAARDDGVVRAGAAETSLFITPGYRFRVVDRLITNFHLPKSTLLMLVSAFAGVETIRQAYAHAIAARYRFFSYGDAMLLERAR